MKSTCIISTKVFINFTLIVLSIVICLSPAWARKEKLTVMTQNLYLGAEIQSLANAPDIGAFLVGAMEALDQVADNDFTERAEALAALIVKKDPELIGLQEVYVFKSTSPELNGSPPFLDYLDELKEALSAQGACYNDVATVTNFDFGPIPVPFYGPVRITDRDVILARCDVETVPVDLQSVCPRPSVVSTDDGCTYEKTASTVIPGIGTFPDIPLEFKRGYVAVDVIESFPLRFFNTHLEVRYPAENEFAPAIQAAQAIELITIIGLLPPPEGAPVIVVGDINSSPEDEVIDLGFMAIVPPYMQFVDKAGYTEAWTFRPGKPKLRPGKPKLRPAKPKDFTCCQDEDLLNKKSALYERIDVIFSSELPVKVKAKVVGNHKKDKTPSGLWPSDHAGVVARLYFEPFPKPKKHFKAKRRHRH